MSTTNAGRQRPFGGGGGEARRSTRNPLRAARRRNLIVGRGMPKVTKYHKRRLPEVLQHPKLEFSIDVECSSKLGRGSGVPSDSLRGEARGLGPIDLRRCFHELRASVFPLREMCP